MLLSSVHHAGWDTKREKGSIALRAAADVVIETSLGDEKPDGSRIVTLTCRKMKSIRKFEPFSIALVPVDVVSPGGTFKCLAVGHPITVLDEVPSETENHGRTLVRVLSEHFPVGATYTQLKDKSGLQKTTFISGLNCATNEKKWIVGGRGQRCRYLLNPDGSWKAAVMAKEFQTQTGTEIQTGTGPQSTPYRGVD